jgi:hypothetical protein
MEIFKYILNIQHQVQIVNMFENANILAFQMQGKTPCIWAEVDLNQKMVFRKFLIVGTGWDLPPDRKYIGTVQVSEYAWHLYENIK